MIVIIVPVLECLETDLSSSPGQWSGYTAHSTGIDHAYLRILSAIKWTHI